VPPDAESPRRLMRVDLGRTARQLELAHH
jgi:hypothetical protein